MTGVSRKTVVRGLTLEYLLGLGNVLMMGAALGGLEAMVLPDEALGFWPRVAQEEAIDLIVMGTHGHTGLTHVLLGSAAETVLYRSTPRYLMAQR